MPDVNVYEAFKELIQRLMAGDEEVAELAATDPEGLLAAFGVTDGDLDGVDFRQAVDDCYHDYDLPESSRQALQSYVSGGAPPEDYQVKSPPATEAHQTPEHAVQHLQYVTYATHENNETVTREIVNQQFTIDQSDNRSFDFDNSTDLAIDVGRDFDGDITVAPTTAFGDGAVATTGDNNVIGTGDGDLLNADRGGEINAATGDGAIQGERVEGANTGEFNGALAGRDVEGSTNTGQFEGVQAGQDADGTTSTGGNSGIVADGDVDRAVVGDDNQSANLDIDASGGDGGNAGGFGGIASGTGGAADGTGGGSGFGGDADGTGGDATGGAGGDVGPINLNFGSGDQTSTSNVDGSAVASGGSAANETISGDEVQHAAPPKAAVTAEEVVEDAVDVLPETDADDEFTPQVEELVETLDSVDEHDVALGG